MSVRSGHTARSMRIAIGSRSSSALQPPSPTAARPPRPRFDATPVTDSVPAYHEAARGTKALYGIVHGPRLSGNHHVLTMSADELQAAHPFTTKIIFNEKMTRGDFDTRKVPKSACLISIAGSPSGKIILGNEEGELLPFLLHAACAANRTRGLMLPLSTCG